MSHFTNLDQLCETKDSGASPDHCRYGGQQPRLQRIQVHLVYRKAGLLHNSCIGGSNAWVLLQARRSVLPLSRPSVS